MSAPHPSRLIVADLIEIDFQVEFDFGDIVRKLGAAAHDRLLAGSMKIAAVQRQRIGLRVSGKFRREQIAIAQPRQLR